MIIETCKKYLRKTYTEFATHVYDIPQRMLALLILIIFLTLPYGGIDLLKTLPWLTTANIMAILAVSWDLLVGRTGQMSLGQALFYGSGAYGTALLFTYLGWPLWASIPLSILFGTGLALIIGVPCLRMKGPYLALLTMAFPLSITGFLYYFRDIFYGETGIPPPRAGRLPSLFPYPGRFSLFDKLIADYFLSFALMFISAIIIYKVATSKTGIVFVSILDDELGAKACGINVTKYKLMSFVISGIFGSLSGSLYASLQKSLANPPFFDLLNSVIPIVATILGGIGTIYGPIVGTYIYYTLDKYIFHYVIPLDKNMRLLIYIVVVVIFIIKWPRGIARAIVEKLEDLQEPREIEEIKKENVRPGE